MKILCETQVVNRTTQTNRTPRAVKSTLAVGFNTNAKDSNGNSTKQLEIIHFTPQNRMGTRYKLQDNIEKMFTKFVQDGKVTISFRQPPENLMIKCDPVQLKGFLKTIKLGLEGKECINLRLNIAAATAIPQKSQPQQSMTVLSRGDYPTKGFPKSLKTLKISGIKLCKVTFEICSLRNLTSLDLSDNQISKLPSELGRLSLTELHINGNALGESNVWQWLQGNDLQKCLRSLDLSDNKLMYFPWQLVKCCELVTLKLNNNSLKRIPFAMRRMRNLRYLHLSSNLLESVPAAINHSRLELLNVWDNNFQPKMEHQLETTNRNGITTSAPLWVLAARAVSQYKLPYTSATLPWVLVDVLEESPKCACGKLCFAGAILERAAMATLENVKSLVHSRDRLIYADIVLCGSTCAGRKQMLA